MHSRGQNRAPQPCVAVQSPTFVSHCNRPRSFPSSNMKRAGRVVLALMMSRQSFSPKRGHIPMSAWTDIGPAVALRLKVKGKCGTAPTLGPTPTIRTFPPQSSCWSSTYLSKLKNTWARKLKAQICKAWESVVCSINRACSITQGLLEYNMMLGQRSEYRTVGSGEE
jgi:hypothetical protein